MLVRKVTHDLCNLLKPYDHMLLFTGANQQGGVVGRGEGLGGGAGSGEGGGQSPVFRFGIISGHAGWVIRISSRPTQTTKVWCYDAKICLIGAADMTCDTC